jgi:hypothetical protein
MSMVFEKKIYNSKKTQIQKDVYLFIPFKSNSKTKTILAWQDILCTLNPSTLY